MISVGTRPWRLANDGGSSCGENNFPAGFEPTSSPQRTSNFSHYTRDHSFMIYNTRKGVTWFSRPVHRLGLSIPLFLSLFIALKKVVTLACLLSIDSINGITFVPTVIPLRFKPETIVHITLPLCYLCISFPLRSLTANNFAAFLPPNPAW